MSSQFQVHTKYRFVHEILEDILRLGPSYQHPTTLIVCSTKEDFLTQLVARIGTDTDIDGNENENEIENENECGGDLTATTIPKTTVVQDEIPASQEDLEADDSVIEHDGAQRPRRRPEQHRQQSKSPATSTRDRLLTPTLHLLSTSRNIKLIFCPTITTFRAYMSVYISSNPSRPTIVSTEAERYTEDNSTTAPLATTAEAEAEAINANTNTNANAELSSPLPNLFVLNLVQLHQGTSEFTLQGLSHTLATTVSAAFRNHTRLILVECQDILDPTNPARGPKLWDMDVPLLSGSVKIKAATVGAAGWLVGQTLSIRKIASRWFEFVQ